MDRQSDKLSINRRVNPKSAGEKGEGNPTVGNFSTWKFVRPESATASMSFFKIKASLRVRDFAALPRQQCPGKDVHRFLRMRLQRSCWANQSYGLIKFGALVWHSSWRVSPVGAPGCPRVK